MKLRKYLWDNELCMTTFAQKIGYNRGYMSQIMSGKVKPGKRCARDIEAGTNGFIKAEELLNGSFLKKDTRDEKNDCSDDFARHILK